MDKLLRIKTTAAGLFYPAMPSLEEARTNESEEERKKKEQGNRKRKIDMENECKSIEFREQFVERYLWNEADTKKVYSIYQSELKRYKFTTRKIHTQKLTHSARMNSLMSLLSHSRNQETQFMIASK